VLSEENYNELKDFATENDMALFGVAKLKEIKNLFHQSLRQIADFFTYGISIGYRLSDAVLETIKDEPTLIYKHHYKTVNWILDQTAERISNIIQGKGKKALAVPASQTVDWELQVGHLPHIIVAREAGLGWIGRSGLLVNPIHGARVRYATILTDLQLISDNPLEGNCGDCRKCIEACPASAITMKNFDKQKCLNKLKQFAAKRGIGQYICGVCVKVCKGETSIHN
jgi:epoxyqueuosine reductase